MMPKMHAFSKVFPMKHVSTRSKDLVIPTRSAHSIKKERTLPAELDSGLTDPNLTMWRSINAEHKETEQMPTDQTESIMNYYKERWVQEHRGKAGSDPAAEGKEGIDMSKVSLYSQLARRTGDEPPRAQNKMDYGNVKSFDPFNNPNNQKHHPRPSMSMMNQQMPNQVQQAPKVQDIVRSEVTGPYRPSFNISEMVSGKLDQSRSGEESSSQNFPNPTNSTKNDGDGQNTAGKSPNFQPTSPPQPDFKATNSKAE